MFKKGNHSDPVNYHPISLTSVCCKLLECIIYSKTMFHLSEHNNLSDAQFGFWHRLLTELWLLHIIHDFASNLNGKNKLILVFHCLLKLIIKLNFYDIKHQAYPLSKQMQCVAYSSSYSGHLSGPFDVISGIPQDTVLGPLFGNNIISIIYQSASLLPAVYLEVTLCYYRKIESAEDCM